MPRKKKKTEQWATKVTRDLVLFVVGLGLTINEAVIRSGPERPTLLTLFAAMMGLPIILRAQERKNEAPDHKEDGK